MKSYNIAVCLSGEPRTWQHTAEAIKYFFSSDVHTYKFFGHTWNHSFYNKEHRLNGNLKNSAFKWHDHYDTQNLHNILIDAFGITKLLVEDKKIVSDICNFSNIPMNPEMVSKFGRENAANQKKPIAWSHMSYSKMRANSLKTQYELENEMQFDVVVSARFDVCYPTEAKFDQLLQYQGTILPTALYGETQYFPNEYFLPHVNDVMYFGNSRIMNVVEDFYRYFASGKFWEMLDENYTDCALKSCGYNVNLYKWLTLKNILIKTNNQSSVVFRKTAEHLKWPQDWNEIINANSVLFR